MLTFSHRFNKFDILIIATCIILAIIDIIKYFMSEDPKYAGLAFLLSLTAIIYYKIRL